MGAVLELSLSLLSLTYHNAMLLSHEIHVFDTRLFTSKYHPVTVT